MSDTLHFVTIEGLYRACGSPEGRLGTERKFCDACFTGDYPVVRADSERTPVLPLDTPHWTTAQLTVTREECPVPLALVTGASRGLGAEVAMRADNARHSRGSRREILGRPGRD